MQLKNQAIELAGIGLWLPEKVRSNDAWSGVFEDNAARRASTFVEMPSGGQDRIDAICARHIQNEAGDPFLGCTTRRVVDEHTTAAEAEAAAARSALAEAKIDPEEVDVVLSWSTVPDRLIPTPAPRVADLLQARRAWAMGTDAGCASPLLQLAIAAGLIASGQARCVVLTQSNLNTRVLPLEHPASPSAGDGASAWVVVPSDGPSLLGVWAHSKGDLHDAVTMVRGRTDEDDTPWWQAGGSFRMGTKNRAGAKGLMRDTVRYGVDTVQRVCAEVGVAPEEIDLLASTQPRGWVPAAIAEGLGIDPERAPSTYDRHAQLGATSLTANLLEARRGGRLATDSLVAMYSQGAGFTRAAALVRWRAPVD